MEQNYHYYAFISYSHDDSRWARRLHRELEQFRLPTVLQKAGNGKLPERIRPVFLDATDLAVGKLKEKLHDELERSKFLIVVCSPHSAVPNAEGAHWVDAEVLHFSEIGRIDRIIPVIVDGTPQTAFCPSLKRLGVLALDATRTSRRRIVSDIVAKVLGLAPDELWRREQRRRKKKMLWRTAMFSLQAFIAVLLIWYAVDWNMETVRYYQKSREVFGLQEDAGIASTGVSEGENLIPKDKLKEFDRACRFVYRGYDSWKPWKRKPLLREVTTVDSFDKATIDTGDYLLHPKASGRRYVYDERSLPVCIEILDADGKPVNGDAGVGKIVNVFDASERLKEQIFYGPDDEQCCPKGFDFCRFVYKYAGEQDNIVATNLTYARNGSWQEFERNRNGRPVRVSFFDADGSYAHDALGISSYTSSYDENGNETKREFLNGSGERILSSEHIAGWNSEFDNMGNETVRRFFGLNDELKEDLDGIAIIEFTYDSNSNRISKDVYDRNHERTADNYGFGGIRWEYDDSGRATAEYRIDRKGNIVVDEAGVGIVRLKLDDSGNAIERHFYGTNAVSVVRNVENICGWKSKFDAKGRETERRFIDEKGDFCRGRDGTGGWLQEYDDNGRIVRSAMIDETGKPSALIMEIGGVKLGYSEVRSRYLSNGRQMMIALATEETAKMLGAKCVGCTIGANGKVERYDMMDMSGIVTSSLGWATKRVAFNSYNEITEQSYWDVENNPAISVYDGIHKNVLSYKRKTGGLTVDIRCFDTNGFLAVSRELGFAWAVKQYDPEGRLLSVETYDENRKPICGKGLPASKVKIAYDTQGRMTRLTVSGESQRFDVGIEYPHPPNGPEDAIRIVEFSPDGAEKQSKVKKIDDPSVAYALRLGKLRYALDANGAPIDIERQP